MGFRTKLDYSDNRQLIQRERTSTGLSGKTVFGMAFSALTSGPNPDNSGTTVSSINVVSTFSGNTGTTVFTFGASYMDIAEDEILTITPSTSALTQNTGIVWVPDSTTVIDGNTVALSYSGVSYDIEISAITETSPGTYTGTAFSTEVFYYTAGTLDYLDRTIWIDNLGITKTKDLIITEGAVDGYVWTASGSSGEGYWAPSSGGTSGGTDFYTTGGTLIGTTAYFDRNDTLSAYTIDLSGLTSSATTYWEAADSGTQSFKSIYGTGHTVEADYSMIGGGRNNTINGTNPNIDGSIIGGYQNQIYSTGGYILQDGIFVGRNNTISGDTTQSTIIGGINNILTSSRSSIIGGFTNTLNGTDSVMVGGYNNVSTENRSAVIGGISNKIYGNSTNSAIGGGNSNVITGDSTNSFIAAGGSNTLSSSAYSIVGGLNNNITTSNRTSIIGGRNNDSFEAFESIIGGGYNNEIFYLSRGGIFTGRDNFIGNNYSLNIYSTYAVIVGGRANSITGNTIGSFVGGGRNNTITFTDSYGTDGAKYTSIGGGSYNTISGQTNYSVIGGGTNNTINSKYSGILGGNGNLITHNNAFIIGTGITSVESGATHVNNLIIDGLTSTDPIATDANGKIVAGTSDKRLKRNIEPIEGALDKIMNFQGVSFEYTEESNMGDGTRFGFIAQDVQQIIPEMVRKRAKDDEMLSLSYTEVVPWLVEAVKELGSETGPIYSREELILETQTIAAEDNNIELNYGGTPETAFGGGIKVLHALGDGEHAELTVDKQGKWVATSIKTQQLSLPEYTPESSADKIGSSGDVVWDDDFIYIKTNNGWKRSSLESF